MLVKVIGTIISSAIDNVCDAIFFKDLFILGNEVAAKIEEPVDDFRANAFVILIFILLS